MRKKWKWILLTLLAVVVLIPTVGLPYLMARLVTSAGTRPMDLELTTSPADYELAFEDVSFEATDGTPLSGWYLGGADSDVSVACGHGLFRSRREVLDRAAFFRRQGFNTLVFDFRRHGDSGGERVSLGYHERQDFAGAVRFLKEKQPSSRIVLYGVSMGAAAALLAARETPDVDAVVADSPFLSFEHTVVHHVDLIFGLPRFPFASSLMFFLEQRGGFDRDDFDLEKASAAFGGPVLIVAGKEDRRMPEELQRRLYDASPSAKSEFRAFAEAGHGRAYRSASEDYEEMVVTFLDRAGLTRSTSVDAGEGSSPASR